MRMVEGRQRLRFTLKAALKVWSLPACRDLDGNASVQPCVVGGIDLAHAAGTQRVLDDVMGQPRAAGAKASRVILTSIHHCAVMFARPLRNTNF
jgi:hypothetical protein